MSFDQFIQTDQYFSGTWSSDSEQTALSAMEMAGIPVHLVERPIATIRITLMSFHNRMWFHDFVMDVAQAADGIGSAYIDDLVLIEFVNRARRVIRDGVFIEDMFPGCPDCDIDTVEVMADKFQEIMDTVPDVDLVYTYTF